MPSGGTIRFEGVSKHFGPVQAVNDLSFTVQPGRVTGFLGPNGAGKTTSLRMLLGLVRPTSGTATFDGIPYRDLDRPLATVGAALEAASFHPGRSARNHLKVYAQAAGLPQPRVERVLEQVGLSEYADRRVGGYSLGMRQRLGLANALLGDPGVLVLDEPVNGLDPEGIRWIRGFLREMAGEGRTVLVSSHLLSEVQQSVDDVVILAKGRLVHRGPLASLGAETSVRTTVDSPDRAALRAALTETGHRFEEGTAGFVVLDVDAIEVGRTAHLARVPLSELHAEQTGLEDRFLALVNGEEAR
jgi:ABC-2 type transport system ATP-binding protein